MVIPTAASTRTAAPTSSHGWCSAAPSTDRPPAASSTGPAQQTTISSPTPTAASGPPRLDAFEEFGGRLLIGSRPSQPVGGGGRGQGKWTRHRIGHVRPPTDQAEQLYGARRGHQGSARLGGLAVAVR